MKTKLIKCSCAHAEQDAMYRGLRLHNIAGTRESIKWRCTVCLNEIND